MPAETPIETFNLLRMGNKDTSVQQILYVIFTPIQAIVNVILNLICWLITPTTAIIEAIRGSVLVNLISLLELVIPLVSVAAPQVGVVLQAIQLVLNAGNLLLYNGTVIIQDYGCTTILSINNVISSIINTIIGVF